MITAIEAGFDLSAESKTPSEKVDMLLDYISDVESKKAKEKFKPLIDFYNSEINAAKNKLKQVSLG